jgi:hypothetical protein
LHGRPAENLAGRAAAGDVFMAPAHKKTRPKPGFDASADPLGRDPLAPRGEKSLGHHLRNSFERTDKTPAGDARSSQGLSSRFYLIAFHPYKGNVEAQSTVPL